MSQSYSLEQKILPSSSLARSLVDLTPSRANGNAAYHILCAARYGQLGASSRLRLLQFRPWLERAGFSTSLRSFLSDHYIRALYSNKSRTLPVAAAYLRAFGAGRAARRHDLIWIEKEYLPWLPHWLERHAIGNTPYVLDFDDAWALRYQRAKSKLVRGLLGQKFSRLLRGAALTITANQTLYDWAAQEGAPNILLLPTVVDLDHYIIAPEPAGPFTICWIGTPLTASYLQAIAEPLRTLAAEAPLKLLIIGAPEASIKGVDCQHADWSEAAEAGLIAQAHAGIMPLPDDEWARGKSGYKLIQYMAMARPTVGSPIGANQTIVEHGHTGFLATTATEWLMSLRTLRDNPALRAEMGSASRRRVEQNFSLQVAAPILIEALSKILHRH